MAAPWLKYQATTAGKPWEKYAKPQGAEASPKAPTMVNGEDAATMPAWKNAAYGLAAPVASTIVGAGQLTGLMDPQTARESLARIDAVRSRTPGKIAGAVGDVGMFALAPEAKGVGIAKWAQTALQGGALAGVQGVHDGESRGVNAALGAGLNVAGQGLSNGLQHYGAKAMDAIKPEARAIYEAAKARGITLSPGQLSDSKPVKYLESVISSLPFSGVAAKAADQVSIFNRKLAEAIGVQAPVITPEVYAAKKAADSAKFNELTSRNNLTVTGSLAQKLHAIQQDAKLAGSDVHGAVTDAIDRLYSQMSPDGLVPGRAYQSLDTSLGKTSRTAPSQPYIAQVKQAIRSEMDKSISPADQQAWSQLRREYGVRKDLRDLVSKSGGGELSPQAVMGRVTRNDYGKEAMATGSHPLFDLARIGNRMKEPPNSGTAPRQAVMDAFDPLKLPRNLALSVAGIGSHAINNAAVAKFLMRKNAGKLPQFLAPYARQAPVGLAALLMPQPQGND